MSEAGKQWVTYSDLEVETLEDYSYAVEEGIFEFQMCESLASGNYTVQLMIGERFETYRIIKE